MTTLQSVVPGPATHRRSASMKEVESDLLSPVRFRVIGSGGRYGLTIIKELSGDSQYLRLHPPIRRFTDSTWKVLREARPGTAGIVAEMTIKGQPVVVGLARLFRLGGDIAQVALAVGDRWQGRGIGRDLLAALGELAAHIGVRELRAELTTQMHGRASMMRATFPGTTTTWAGSVVRVSSRVPAAADRLATVGPIAPSG